PPPAACGDPVATPEQSRRSAPRKRAVTRAGRGGRQCRATDALVARVDHTVPRTVDRVAVFRRPIAADWRPRHINRLAHDDRCRCRYYWRGCRIDRRRWGIYRRRAITLGISDVAIRDIDLR